MKKTIAAALTFIALSTGVTFAQRGYPAPQQPSRYGGQPSGQYGGPRYDADQAQDNLKIDRIDAIVGLSRRQEKQLHRIEDAYDQQMARSRMTPDAYRQLQLRKRQDMLAILTPAQRDRLFAHQSTQRSNVLYGRRG